MNEVHIPPPLFFVNYILGISLVILSFSRYIRKKVRAPLYISSAVILAGPLEDILVDMVNSDPYIPPFIKKKYVVLIDQFTSMGFLMFLILAIWES